MGWSGVVFVNKTSEEALVGVSGDKAGFVAGAGVWYPRCTPVSPPSVDAKTGHTQSYMKGLRQTS